MMDRKSLNHLFTSISLSLYSKFFVTMVNKEGFKPDKLTVRQLLSDSYNFYNIPEYQRPYKWKEKQIEDLIKDVKDSMDTGEYFIGSIILVKKEDRYDVIDGQQRLITLTLILSAFYNEFRAKELEKCLIDTDHEQERYRIKISARVDQRNDFDQGFINRIRDGKEPDSNEQNIFARYYYVTKDLLEKHEVLNPRENAEKFYNHLLDSVSLIRVYTESEGFAVKLFYVMNTRGTSLSNDEVIKVLLYDKLDAQGRETFMGSWRAIEGDRSKLYGFWKEFDRLDKIFTLYSYYSLGEKPRTLVYDTYARMVSKGETPLAIVYKVKKFGDSLVELHRQHQREDSLIQDDRSLYPFYYLYDRVFWQVILGAAIDIGYPDLKQLIQGLLRLYYLNWISGHNTGNIRDISIKVLKLIKDRQGITDIINLIETKILNEGLETGAFDILNKEVYSDKPKSWLHAILCLIEYDLYDDSGVSFIEQSGQGSPSIDHILPKNWSSVQYWNEHWTKDDANENMYKLGNVTLLSLAKNVKLGNLDFVSKKMHYLGEIGNGKATRYKLTDRITRIQDWDLKALKDRQDWMIEKLKDILKTSK